MEVEAGALTSRLTHAELADHHVSWAQGKDYPMIIREDGGRAQGVLLRDVCEDEKSRLRYYEGAFSYDLEIVQVTTDRGSEQAVCFYPMTNNDVRGDDWHLADWVNKWGALAVGTARDVMARADQYDAKTVAGWRSFLMARHWARALAKDGTPSTVRRDAKPGDVTVQERLPGFNGFFETAAFRFDHVRFDGSRSPSVMRETFLAFDAALVLPYDPKTDHVLLIEQLRFGPLWREDPNPWVFEPIAGVVDAGEAPEDAARREAVEEAGLSLGPLEHIAKVYASPGYSTEFFHCYLSVTDLNSFSASANGLVSEHEDIRSHVLSFERVMQLVSTGEVNAGPLVMMLYWLASQRARLRSVA